LAAGSAVLAVYLLRLDRIAGLIVDDAWYVLLGKALAQGNGFRLISSAASPIQPVVPPGYPALLALVFTFNPGFPQNILWLKSVSVAAMLGTGLATGWYFLRDRRLQAPVAIALAAATALTPALVFLATSTAMAECVFILGQMIAIVVVERSMRSPENAARGSVAAAAVAASATMLVRSSGLALIAAVCVYLLFARRWKSTLLFAVITLCCLAPWTIYSAGHAPTQAERIEHGGTISVPYSDAMQMRSILNPAAGRMRLRDWPERFAGNFMNICCRDIVGITFPELLRGAAESGQEALSVGKKGDWVGSMGNAPITMVISALLAAVALAGWIVAVRGGITLAEIFVPVSIAMILPVPVWTYRYMLPLTPFVFFYLYRGLAAVSVRVARMAVLAVLAFSVLDHAQYILLARGPNRADAIDWAADSREVDEVLAWMNEHLDRNSAVASTNPALVYLLTNRKGVALDDPLVDANLRRWKARGVRYLVSLNPVEAPHSSRHEFKLLYQTSRRKLWIVEI